MKGLLNLFDPDGLTLTPNPSPKERGNKNLIILKRKIRNAATSECVQDLTHLKYIATSEPPIIRDMPGIGSHVVVGPTLSATRLLTH